ncbi:hypothetical protein [Thermus caliditerrae]|uniref:hypothetical protein n=1 Tax=Thermus caliditerrae TaxID=1330700 RepID=UPI001F47435E|nr:hypothetical protein [Thermus caliditerrae]
MRVRRWLTYALLLVVAFFLGWVGYREYVWLQALEGRVASLEARLSAQEDGLRGLADRVGKLEGEVFKAPAPPLSLPAVPEAPGVPAWPYAVGVVVVALLLYLLLRMLQGGGRARATEGTKGENELHSEISRMEDEGAPPSKG